MPKNQEPSFKMLKAFLEKSPEYCKILKKDPDAKHMHTALFKLFDRLDSPDNTLKKNSDINKIFIFLIIMQLHVQSNPSLKKFVNEKIIQIKARYTPGKNDTSDAPKLSHTALLFEAMVNGDSVEIEKQLDSLAPSKIIETEASYDENGRRTDKITTLQQSDETIRKNKAEAIYALFSQVHAFRDLPLKLILANNKGKHIATVQQYEMFHKYLGTYMKEALKNPKSMASFATMLYNCVKLCHIDENAADTVAHELTKLLKPYGKLLAEFPKETYQVEPGNDEDSYALVAFTSAAVNIRSQYLGRRDVREQYLLAHPAATQHAMQPKEQHNATIASSPVQSPPTQPAPLSFFQRIVNFIYRLFGKEPVKPDAPAPMIPEQAGTNAKSERPVLKNIKDLYGKSNAHAAGSPKTDKNSTRNDSERNSASSSLKGR